ncbi:unnamed protein product [Rotaria sordida]|uniref:Sodium/potassium-transporting ATPase subunit beta-1 n=1 Tax=Rotaria sordida TaxID=392033 RepID=A0A813MYB4_9BILA|nr:unnamed protein product [Rotaria sordida]CAF0942856.1 unnamed protein product [Rotaria sordida]
MINREIQSSDITIEPTNVNIELQKNDTNVNNLLDKNIKKTKNSRKSFAKFLYNSKRKTVLGRDALNWAKLSIFYTILYCFLGCFFVALTYVFARILDRTQPRYYNTESTMAVRSTAAVVGLGFRPQPVIDESLIQITNDPIQQKRIASSLRLFRNVFLLQNSDAKVEQCSSQEPASKLPPGTACLFNWYHIVKNENHPCSDNKMYGFSYEQPCILIKLNKVYGWKPVKGILPFEIQKLRHVYSNKSISNSDVYITCAGTHAADTDVLLNATYYSLSYPFGSSKFGVIPNYFFPYQNAKDHVQPFVLVQFNMLPLNRLVSVTCLAWAPGIEHNTRRMRGMVNFQLYRTHTDIKYNENNGR